MNTQHILKRVGENTMKLCAPAAERNKKPLLEVLQRYIKHDETGKLLEISSGSGQHVDYMAPHFPKVTFQPTEFDESSLRSIAEYAKPHKNVLPPRFLDASAPSENWLDGEISADSFDYVLNVNMLHVSEWKCAQGLFAGCKRIIKSGGFLFTYGAYADNGIITPQSNVSFDASIRSQNPSWGLRDITREVVPLAEACDISLYAQHDMPANNKFLVWQKKL